MAYGNEVEKLERRWMENPMGVTFAPLAEAYRRAGDHARALEILAAGLLNHPAYVPALIVQARCHLDVGEDQPAEASFRLVLEGDRHNLIALKGLADICERGGRTAEAIAFLGRLLEADPTHDEASAQAARLAALAPAPAEAVGVAAPEPEPDETFLPPPAPVTVDIDAAGPLEIEVVEAVLPDPGLTDSLLAAEEVALEKAVEAMDVPGIEPGPEGSLDAGDIGVEREEGPFDDFNPAEWSGVGLGSDQPPDLPFEEAEVLGSIATPAPEAEPAFEASAEVPPVPELDDAPAWQEASSFEPVTEEAPESSDWLAELPTPEDEAEPMPVGGFEATVESAWGAPDEGGFAEAEEAQEAEEAATPEPAAETVGSPEPTQVADEFGWGGWLGASGSEQPVEPAESEEPAEAEAPVGVAETFAQADETVAEPVEEVPGWVAPEVAQATGAAAVEAPGTPEDDIPHAVGPQSEVPAEEDLVEVVEGAAAEAPQDAPPAEIEPELVITETMARLFERQGHHTMALAVYAQLLEREPSNEAIREAVHRLKAEIAPDSTGGESVGQLLARGIEPPPAAPVPPAPPVASLDAPPTSAAPEPVNLGAIFGPPRPGAARTRGEEGEAGPSFDEFFAGAPGQQSGGQSQSEDEELEQFSAWLRTLKH